MSNLRQAAQQALEAMCCMRDMVAHPDNLAFIDKHISVLQAALAEPEQEANVQLPPGFEFQPAFVPRKPLTDEEIDQVTQQQWGEMRIAPLFGARLYARAIERAHGIGEQT